MKVFVVVDIGCIECGEGTEVLGVYKTAEEARERGQLGNRDEREYFSHGQRSVQMFESEVL